MKASILPITKAEFRTRVREIMRVRDITTAELAQTLDVQTTSVSYLLHNDIPPSPRTVRRYASALGVSEAFLRGETNIEASLREVEAGDKPAVTIAP